MNKCRICGHSANMEKYIIKEMMYGTKEEFEYFVCGSCGCMQISTVPNNLGDYYKDNYYSYSNSINTKKVERKDGTRVLDVGCGAGALLCAMAEEGMYNLTGCDPFISDDIEYENGVKIYKRTIHEMEGEYDWIFMNDSYEHMTDPHEVMDSVSRLLAKGGIVKIRIPVFPNIAWDMFKENWFQIDAPRHIFLHSVNSMALLAEKHDFKIARTEYDSGPEQIYCSFLYDKGIALREQSADMVYNLFSKEEMNDIENMVEEVNAKQYGDHATFYLIKRDSDEE